MAALLSENWVGAPGGACEVGAPDVAVGARREGRAAGGRAHAATFATAADREQLAPDANSAPRLGFPKPVPTPRLASCTLAPFDHARRSMGAQSSSLFEPWSTGSTGLKLVAVQRSVRLRL